MIGGTCIEIRTEGHGLLLDIGMPLVNADGSGFDEDSAKRPVEELIRDGLLPNVSGLYDKANCNIDGIVLTHAHRDHFGLGHFIKSGIPIFSSEITKKLIGANRMFFPDTINPERITSLEAWKPVSIGPFTVSTHPVDHSAPGAIAVEVSAGGKKVFYTGDLRAHGYKKKLFENIIKRPPANIDVMFMEGSSLGRKETEYPYPDELAVRDAIIEEIKDEKALILLFCSSQNADRIVSASRAAQASGRELVLDYYTAYILYLLKDKSRGITNVLSNSRFLYWPGHGNGLSRTGEYKFLSYIKAKKSRILPKDIPASPEKFLVVAKANRRLAEITAGLEPEQIKCIWSMWSGYLEDTESLFKKFCDKNKIPYTQIHTSGHAGIKDLGRLVKAVNPKRLVPIHTFHPDDYKQFIDPSKLEVMNDGDTYEI